MYTSTEDAEFLKQRILECFLQFLTEIQTALMAAGGYTRTTEKADMRATHRTVEHQTCLDIISGDAFDEETSGSLTAAIEASGASASSTTGGGTSRSTQPLTARAVAEAEIKNYLDMKEPPTLTKYSLTSTLEWWEKVGSVAFPLVGRAARALLTIRAAAAIIEVDFCLANHMVSPKRSSLDSAFVEMTLVLNSLGKLIPRPECVPKLTVAQAADAIPDRFGDDEVIAAAVKLDYAEGARGVGGSR